MVLAHKHQMLSYCSAHCWLHANAFRIEPSPDQHESHEVSPKQVVVIMSPDRHFMPARPNVCFCKQFKAGLGGGGGGKEGRKVRLQGIVFLHKNWHGRSYMQLPFP